MRRREKDEEEDEKATEEKEERYRGSLPRSLQLLRLSQGDIWLDDYPSDEECSPSEQLLAQEKMFKSLRNLTLIVGEKGETDPSCIKLRAMAERCGIELVGEGWWDKVADSWAWWGWIDRLESEGGWLDEENSNI